LCFNSFPQLTDGAPPSLALACCGLPTVLRSPAPTRRSSEVALRPQCSPQSEWSSGRSWRTMFKGMMPNSIARSARNIFIRLPIDALTRSQCDNNVQVIGRRRTLLVAPPRKNSRNLECPYAPITNRSISCSITYVSSTLPMVRPVDLTVANVVSTPCRAK